jgi:hypothetical protein
VNTVELFDASKIEELVQIKDSLLYQVFGDFRPNVQSWFEEESAEPKSVMILWENLCSESTDPATLVMRLQFDDDASADAFKLRWL